MEQGQILENEKKLKYNQYHREYYYRKKQERLEKARKLAEVKAKELKGEN